MMPLGSALLWFVHRIESSDLPLLAAVASTHSPYVAQILLWHRNDEEEPPEEDILIGRAPLGP